MELRSLARRLLRVSLDARDTMTTSSDIAERPNQTCRAMLGDTERPARCDSRHRAGHRRERALRVRLRVRELADRTIVPSNFTPDGRQSNHGPVPPRERDDDEFRIVLMSNIS